MIPRRGLLFNSGLARDRAFTLIELTLVTVIILALVGLSIPIFRNTFSDLSAKDAAFNISKIVSYAQEKAIMSGKNYKVAFNYNRRIYQLVESVRSNEGITYIREKSRFGKPIELPAGLSFYDPKTGLTNSPDEELVKQVMFYPDGHCDELSIGVVDKRGNGYIVELKGFGSLPRIKEVKSEAY